jgi:hypothetical protein
MMRRFLAVFIGTVALTIGSCELESWRPVLGSFYNNDAVHIGVEFEFENGFDFIVPIN